VCVQPLFLAASIEHGSFCLDPTYGRSSCRRYRSLLGTRVGLGLSIQESNSWSHKPDLVVLDGQHACRSTIWESARNRNSWLSRFGQRKMNDCSLNRKVGCVSTMCTRYGYNMDATCMSAHIVTPIVHHVASSAFNIGGNVQIQA
jgi:hypothetical protein